MQLYFFLLVSAVIRCNRGRMQVFVEVSLTGGAAAAVQLHCTLFRRHCVNNTTLSIFYVGLLRCASELNRDDWSMAHVSPWFRFADRYFAWWYDTTFSHCFVLWVGVGITSGQGNLDLALLFWCKSCSSLTMVITNLYSVLLVEASDKTVGLFMEQLVFSIFFLFLCAASVVVPLQKG